MTRSIRGSRRAAVLLAGATTTLLLASGCGTGQIAETATKVPTVPGVNAELRMANGEFYQIRNLIVSYPGIEGYPAGGNAPIEVAIFNDTDTPITVTVTSDSARSVVLSGGAAATPTAPAESPTETSPAPSPAEQPPTGEPASIQIPARGFATLNPSTGRQLQLIGLAEAVKAGQSVNLVFDFGGQRLTTQAPVTVPLTPVPVAPPVEGVQGGHE